MRQIPLRRRPPGRLAPIAAAGTLTAVQAQLSAAEAAAIQEANLVLPVRDAVRELAEKLVTDRDQVLQACLVAHLGEMPELAALDGRLTRHPDRITDPANPADVAGEVWAVDGVPLLHTGPVSIRRTGDEMLADQDLRALVPLPAAVLQGLPRRVIPYTADLQAPGETKQG
jgi:hypothetical protein